MALGPFEALPDPIAVAKAGKAPEDGPRIVFLSGGTALRGLSRALTRYTHNSVHLITPFDSGGSSAVIRSAFDLPAVGDLRNRLLALASEGARPLRRLLGRRLAVDASPGALRTRLASLAAGTDPWLKDLSPQTRQAFGERLSDFCRHMPDDFDLRGASLGNLLLAGGALESGSIRRATEVLASMLSARGHVLLTSEANLHLAARLADGSQLVGQHKLTGKQHAPLRSRITELSLVELGPDAATRVQVDAAAAVLQELRRADLVCFPMGSFYTSVLCNTLPRGVGAAVAASACPKLYVPSTGRDPELVDTDLGQAVELLVEALRRDAPGASVEDLLDAVVLDPNRDVYAAPPTPGALEALGVASLETVLVTPHSLPDIDSDRLAQVLVSVAARGRAAGPPSMHPTSLRETS